MIQLLTVAIILLFIGLEVFRIEMSVSEMHRKLNMMDKSWLKDENIVNNWLLKQPRRAKGK